MERISGPDPQRAAAAFATNIAAFHQASLPLFGLTEAAWSGPRSLGEAWHLDVTSHTTGETTRHERSYGLKHGDATRPDQPYVHVRTATPGTADDEPLEWILVAQAEHDHSPEEIAAALQHPLPGATNDVVDIPVDGHPERFHSVSRGSAWVARRIRESYVIVVEARHVAPSQIDLVRIVDISPYVPQRTDWLR